MLNDNVTLPAFVQALFPQEHLSLMVAALLAGTARSRVGQARVFTDRSSPACSALVWDRAHHIFLGGQVTSGFLETVQRCIKDEILTGIGHSGSFMVLTTSGEWDGVLPELFPGIELEYWPRLFFRLQTLRLPDWNRRIPQDFAIHRIDHDLLLGQPRQNLSGLTAEVESMWGSVTAFLENGFGFVALHGDAVAGWCTIEYRSSGRCGIGVETVEAYQGRGLATLTASATTEHCVQLLLTPYWDSWKFNHPSIAVARKVGYAPHSEYSAIVGRVPGNVSRRKEE